jgi:hypothetical protein
MLCHRLLRPIADTHTVGARTDINTVIDRLGADGPARRSSPNRRCMSR